MLFRTRYGTKVTIKSKKLAKDHIEPHNPSLVNVAPMAANTNCVTFTNSELVVAQELQPEAIPDVPLHEWVVENLLDSPEDLIQDVGMGNYVILEPDTKIPNLEKDSDQLLQQQGGLWEMLFDGSKSKNGVGGGAMLISPQGDKYFSAFHFSFVCSNNSAEYERLIQGLEWVRKRGIDYLRVYGDSELIVNQIRGVNIARNDALKSYRNRVWNIIEEFNAFNLISIPRNQNKHAERLAAIGAHFDIPSDIKNI